jgi:hypothetical protein
VPQTDQAYGSMTNPLCAWDADVGPGQDGCGNLHAPFIAQFNAIPNPYVVDPCESDLCDARLVILAGRTGLGIK